MQPEPVDFKSLLDAAARAPSGDNTQPWRFVVDAADGRIALRLDETRDPSPMNTGQRMARIGVGAALENLITAAEGCAWGVELEPASPPDLAVVRLIRQGTGGAIAEAIAARVTNRRPYDARTVPTPILDRLVQRTPTLGGVSTHWVVQRQRLAAAAALIGAADALMFGLPAMRRAFFKQVRFDAPIDAEVEEGLSLGSLELSAPDRLALRLMRHLPNWTLRLGGASRVFSAKARSLVESASGLCIIAAPDRAESTDITVGRAMQRAWLALAEQGLAAQPMMSLPVLENALESPDERLRSALGPERVNALGDRFRALIPELGTGRLAFLIRWGFAAEPRGRTGRLPLARLVTSIEQADPRR